MDKLKTDVHFVSNRNLTHLKTKMVKNGQVTIMIKCQKI